MELKSREKKNALGWTKTHAKANVVRLRLRVNETKILTFSEPHSCKRLNSSVEARVCLSVGFHTNKSTSVNTYEPVFRVHLQNNTLDCRVYDTSLVISTLLGNTQEHVRFI